MHSFANWLRVHCDEILTDDDLFNKVREMYEDETGESVCKLTRLYKYDNMNGTIGCMVDVDISAFEKWLSAEMDCYVSGDIEDEDE